MKGKITMAKSYVFYNPLAGGAVENEISKLKDMLDCEAVFCDLTVTQVEEIVSELEKDDNIVICGGDGTLNRFINALNGEELPCQVLCFPIGTGNDFAHDLGKEYGAAPFIINEYIKDLPWVEVNGIKYRFLNGVGYGIDGYCCEVGDELKKQGKPVNYTSIAIKGLLFGYQPTSAKVTVDGVSRTYKKVWIAPTMHGRFYGGGMMPTPSQKRNNVEKELSLMVFHDTSKLRTLMIFPSIFKGEHIKHTEAVDIITGKEITVEFDRPVALQIDGETVLGVSSYKAYSALVKEKV